MCTEAAVTAQQSVVRCKQSFTLAAGAAQPPPSITPPLLSVNSLIVAAVETAARVRATPYLSVQLRTPTRGKQVFAQVSISQGARLWCCKEVSDKSDWSDVSYLPAAFPAGTIVVTASTAARASTDR